MLRLGDWELLAAPGPRWLLPSNYFWVCEVLRAIAVLLPLTEWKDSPASQELKQNMSDFEEIVRELQDLSGFYWFSPWYLYRYSVFRRRFTKLDKCWFRYCHAHSKEQALWKKLHLGTNDSCATPEQWNLRAQLAAQSERWYKECIPLERDHVFITFPPDTPSVPITRVAVRFKFPAKDSWEPEFRESSELVYNRPIPFRSLASARLGPLSWWLNWGYPRPRPPPYSSIFPSHSSTTSHPPPLYTPTAGSLRVHRSCPDFHHIST